MSRSFKETDSAKVTSLHYSWDGHHLIGATSEPDSLVLFDCQKGAQKR